MLYTTGRRLYIPRHGDLRLEIMKECQDSKWAGHPRIHRTQVLVGDAYFWPKMEDDIEAYVKTSLMGQQDKME